MTDSHDLEESEWMLRIEKDSSFFESEISGLFSHNGNWLNETVFIIKKKWKARYMIFPGRCPRLEIDEEVNPMPAMLSEDIYSKRWVKLTRAKGTEPFNRKFAGIFHDPRV